MVYKDLIPNRLYKYTCIVGKVIFSLKSMNEISMIFNYGFINGVYTEFNSRIFDDNNIYEEIKIEDILSCFPDNHPDKINCLRKEKIKQLLCL